MKVEWSPLADEQVDVAVAYIYGDSPAAALQWLERLLDCAKSLATFPDSGRVVPELGRQDIRDRAVTVALTKAHGVAAVGRAGVYV